MKFASKYRLFKFWQTIFQMLIFCLSYCITTVLKGSHSEKSTPLNEAHIINGLKLSSWLNACYILTNFYMYVLCNKIRGHKLTGHPAPAEISWPILTGAILLHMSLKLNLFWHFLDSYHFKLDLEITGIMQLQIAIS